MVKLVPKDPWTQRYLLISWISEVNDGNVEGSTLQIGKSQIPFIVTLEKCVCLFKSITLRLGMA